MKIKTLLTFNLLLLISINAWSKDKEPDFYDIGSELSNCAGDFEFSSIYLKALGREANAKSVHEFSNGWLLAGFANYYFSGLTSEMSKSTSDGKKETTLNSWFARLESANKDEEKVTKLFDDLASKVESCTLHEEWVVYSQKQIRILISEASKLQNRQ